MRGETLGRGAKGVLQEHQELQGMLPILIHKLMSVLSGMESQFTQRPHENEGETEKQEFLGGSPNVEREHMKSKISVLIALLSVACGNQDEGSLPKNTGLNIDLQFPGAMALHQVEDLKSDIEYYRFEFSGQFSSPIVHDIESKKYQE